LKRTPQLHLQPTFSRSGNCRFLRTSRAMRCFLYLINPESLTQPFTFLPFFLFSWFKWLRTELLASNQRLLYFNVGLLNLSSLLLSLKNDFLTYRINSILHNTPPPPKKKVLFIGIMLKDVSRSRNNSNTSRQSM
jgi:hypothetical protein